MKCLILAAGYATRLYPLTENFPKPLLEVGEKTIIDWLISDLDREGFISEYIVVSNHKFYGFFRDWSLKACYQGKVTILDDGTTDNENRLGAVKDMAYAIKNESIQENLLVIAGDNLTDFSLGKFVAYFIKKNATCIMRHYEDDVERLRKTGVALIDENDKVLEMQEKPREPKSNWAVPPFYIYHENDLQKIVQAVDAGKCNVDAPGDFIAWLCGESDVYAYEMPGRRYDIGSLESYEMVKSVWQGCE